MFKMDASLVYRGAVYPNAEQGFAALRADLDAGAQRISPILRTQLTLHLQLIAKKLAAKHSGSATTANALAKRSGEAVKSIKKGVTIRQEVGGFVGEMRGVHYLSLHETGGVLRPKSGKFLLIPLDAAKNANGTPKYMNPRQWGNTFVSESKAGNLLIFQKRGRNVVPLYALKKSVRIPARLGARKMINDSIDNLVNKVWRDVMRAFP